MDDNDGSQRPIGDVSGRVKCINVGPSADHNLSCGNNSSASASSITLYGRRFVALINRCCGVGGDLSWNRLYIVWRPRKTTRARI